MKNIMLILTVTIICTLILPSCSKGNRLSIAVKNKTKNEIDVTLLQVGKEIIPISLLSQDGLSGSTLYNTSIHDNIYIKWGKWNGKTTKPISEKIIILKDKFPKHFNFNKDTVILNIFEDEIKLSFNIEVKQYEWKEIDSEGNEVSLK